MSRALKISLIVACALIVILGLLVLAAHHALTRQDYQLLRQKLEARTLDATGFALRIRGDLEVPYSLIPTVVARDIVLSNPDYEGENLLLEANEFRIRNGSQGIVDLQIEQVFNSAVLHVFHDTVCCQSGEHPAMPVGAQAQLVTGGQQQPSCFSVHRRHHALTK